MRLRVVHITSTPTGIGGVERLLIAAAPLYVQHGIAPRFVNLFGGRGDGRLVSELESQGVHAFEAGGGASRDLPASVTRLVASLLESRPHIVHLHMYHASIVGSVAALLARVPVRIATRHYLAAGYLHRSWLGRRADVLAARRLDCVIAISAAVREDLIRLGVPQDKVTVIPNGVRLDAFLRTPVRDPRPLEEGLTIGSIGSLRPWKGHAILIEALAVAVRAGANVNVQIAGEGPERASLLQLAMARGVADRVKLIGFHTDPAAFLACVDLYVHPSLDEALGVAVIEAMAAGLPVIASDVGGIPDVLEPNSGVLVPPADPSKLADAIVSLANDADRRMVLAKNARSRAVARFSIETYVSAHAALYRSLVSTQSARPI